MDGGYQEIDLRELALSFKRKWWIIFITTTIALASTYFITENLIVPMYKADTTLFIGSEENNLGISLNDLTRNSRLIEDYQNLAKTRLIIESVLASLEYDIPIKEFQKRMDIKVVADSRLFVVSYSSEDPLVSAQIANELANQLSISVLEIVGVKNIRIIDEAIIPIEPDTPKLLKNLIFGGLSGAVIGIIIVLITFIRDDKVTEISTLENIVSAPIIGKIPRFSDKIRWVNDVRLFIKTKPNDYVSECYKMLRSNISYLTSKNNSKVIMFTSSLSGEGKSTSICNLSVTLASEGKKVILIDADLRKPSVHEKFKFSQMPGLTNYLFGNVDFNKIINRINTLENLHVITSGNLPPSPDLILGSSNFENLIEKLKDEYDYILLDVPPILMVSDALVLTKLIDEVIFVVAMEESKKANVINANSSLSKVGFKIGGIVVTKEKTTMKGKHYEYYLKES